MDTYVVARLFILAGFLLAVVGAVLVKSQKIVRETAWQVAFYVASIVCLFVATNLAYVPPSVSLTQLWVIITASMLIGYGGHHFNHLEQNGIHQLIRALVLVVGGFAVVLYTLDLINN